MSLASLLQRSSIVLAVPRYEHRVTESAEQIKATALLVDGSQLRINEVWIEDQLVKYAYYWLTPVGALVVGWDNAPHHPEIATFPHHVHAPVGVQPSRVRTLDDVLDEIERAL